MKYEVRQFLGKSPKYRVLDYVSLPLGIHLKRNEELNEASITLIDIQMKRRIPKNTRIRIVETESGKSWDFLVVQDVVTRTRAELPELFNHELTLIESTQEFATIQMPNLTFSRLNAGSFDVSSIDDLLNIVNNTSATYNLTGDISFSGETYPFLTIADEFNGILNGNGHTITINNFNPSAYKGLFRSLGTNALITNINFVINGSSSSRMTQTDNNWGIICGTNNGQIEKVSITNSTVTKTMTENANGLAYSWGWLCGLNDTNGLINQCRLVNCNATINFTATQDTSYCYVGSFCGINKGWIVTSYIDGGKLATSRASNILNPLAVGGAVGVQQSIVSQCYLNNLDITSAVGDFRGAVAPKDFKDEKTIYCYFHIEDVGDTSSWVTNSVGTYIPNASDMEKKDTFIGFDFETIWNINEGVSKPFFRAFVALSVYNPLTISNILKRLLNCSKIHWKDERPIYDISPNLLQKLVSLHLDNATEFFFNELNLLEALREIGQKINAIPYLEDYKYVNYYFLNDTLNEKVWTPNDEQACSYSQLQDPNEYATNLVSFSKNVVSSEDVVAGSVEYPSRGGWITPRCDGESTTRINNASAVIDLHGFKIYDIQSVKVKNVSLDEPTKVYDITNYIYEKSQYDLLPDLSSPTSDFQEVRGRALIYDQYGSRIYGFTTTPIRGFTPEYPALNNILMAVSGLSESKINTDYRTLLFNVEFRPVFNNAQSTTKKSLEDFPFEEDLVINQTTNMLSSQNYGNYMRAKMNKMGNIEESFDFQFDTIEQMPELGDRFEDTEYYVNEIVANLYENTIRANITFTKGFNKISEYIAVNSRKRPFALPIDNTVDRHSILKKYLNFSTNPNITPTDQSYLDDPHLTTTFLGNLFYPLGVGKWGDVIDECNLAYVNTFDENMKPIVRSLLPVVSYATPRCLHYSFNMLDNLNAGYYCRTRNSTNKYNGQSALLYTKNGTFRYCTINLLAGNCGLESSDINTEVSMGGEYPYATFASASEIAKYTLSQEWQVDYQKDAREIPYFEEEIHFVSDDGSVIIGDNLVFNNLTVKSSETPYELVKIYSLDRKLGEYEKTVPSDAVLHDLATIVAGSWEDDRGNIIGARILTSLYDVNYHENVGKCWFFADTSGNILLGANEPLTSDANIYVYAQRHRSLPYEPRQAVKVSIDTSSNTTPYLHIYLYGNADANSYNVVDYGDNQKEYFDYVGESGYFNISHNYDDIIKAPNPSILNIYSNSLTSFELSNSPYKINYVSFLQSSIDTVQLFNDNVNKNNFAFNDLDISRLTKITTLNCRNWSTLQSITLPTKNNFTMIDISNTGMVNDESALLSIVNKLPQKPASAITGYVFTCEGTKTPEGYVYWESVLQALTAKGWRYDY